MFIRYENKQVNVDSVTHIVFEGMKVIFNLDYAVSVKNNVDKHIPDYVYFDIQDDDEYLRIAKIIGDLDWISCSEPGTYQNHGRTMQMNHEIINPKAISFVKYEADDKRGNEKNRIIFNLRLSISFSKDVFNHTSGFVFFNYEDRVGYVSDMKRFSTKLEGME